MATRDNDIKNEMCLVEWLMPIYLQARPKFDPDTIRGMVIDGCSQASSILERVIAYLGNYDVVRQDTHDLSDGSDVKYATARFRDGRSTLSANIAGLQGKTGLIRAVVIVNVHTPQFYFLAIPPDVYKGKKSLEIPFNRTYEPLLLKPIWKCIKGSLEELAKFPNSGIVPQRDKGDCPFLEFD